MPLRVTHHPTKGRCVTTTADIKAGEVVHVALPYAIVPDAEQYTTTCAHCVSVPTSSKTLPVQCLGGCERTYYHSESCRASDWRLHKYMCAPIREFRSVINRKSCYVEEYTRLLIRIIATRFSEIEKEASDRLPYESNPEYVADGTPIPKVSSTDETFKSIWKLVSNASNYSKERVKNEFLPVALILTRMIAVHLHPLLPETTKYKTPDLLLPHCTDPTLLTLAREAVYTQNTPISTNPLFTELFEPLLPTLTTTTTPKPPTSDTTYHPTKLTPETTINLLTSTLSLICKEECNSFGHYTYTLLGPTHPRQGYAISLHSSAVFFNHSCAPNIAHTPRRTIPSLAVSVTRGAAMTFFAVDDVARGSELCISYVGPQSIHDFHALPTTTTSTSASPGDGGKHARSKSTDVIDARKRRLNVLERRETLKRLFTFECDCLRCGVECEEGVGRVDEGGKGCGDEEGVEKIVGLYACGVEGCMAFLVPVELVDGEVLKEVKEKMEEEGVAGSVVRVCEGCYRGVVEGN